MLNKRQIKVYLETFGCQMNVSDSERVIQTLTDSGFHIVDTTEVADVVLFNTCSVREKAENKLYTRIGEIRSNRAAPDERLVIGVLGCVAQLEGENLLKRSNRIDFVLGTQAVGRIALIINDVLDSRDPQKSFAFQTSFDTVTTYTATGLLDLGERENDYDWNVNAGSRTSPYIAFVPIIEGCNKFCTYCIVPFSRGRERSRTSSDIIREISKLKAEGVREVHLIGQNVNSYRSQNDDNLTQYRGATAFSRLLRAVAETGIERVKFATSFPRDFHPDIVAAINEHDNLCDWIHLPVQSGSDRILRAMRRGHGIDAYKKQINYIKSSSRRLALTSDLIVGFPGETDDDFAQTLDLVETGCFDMLYIFKYSPRRGTPAAMLDDDVSWETKQKRFIALESAQKECQRRSWQKDYVGKIIDVLAERTSTKNPSDLTGHSTCQKIVNFESPQTTLGQIVKVCVTEVKSNSLYGVLAN